jgi:hypothetical protein
VWYEQRLLIRSLLHRAKHSEIACLRQPSTASGVSFTELQVSCETLEGYASLLDFHRFALLYWGQLSPKQQATAPLSVI